ncbi:hypothetical protein [Mycolicibacterium fluoranthenivorans]|uniref:Membrane-associated oxidoreductase n=1 Tax=Mycolicibacterium fluoranthenivorans TaxID=258505 RepID=A0A7X5U2M5_9MYCO|nr:hypothetical protein [Mycolicibacterium fluoranthenivorans]MCV7354196.1 hypothetical protein [Mycolicibacterium fluoranthenivorans]NIH97236.1 hypothetical protein [Mycolicibacterium fluoranthenivorans]
MTYTREEWVERLNTAAGAGGFLDLGDESAPFPADALREFIFRGGPDLDYPAGITIFSVRIEGLLDLSYLTFLRPLRILGSFIEGPVDLTASTMGTLDFTGTSVQSLSMDGAKVTGDVLLRDGFKSAGEVSCLGTQIGGTLALAHATLQNRGGIALGLDGAAVTGGIVADNLRTTGVVRGVGVRVAGQMILNGAKLINEGGTALSLDGAEIHAGLFASDGFTAVGEVRALSASIGNWLSFRDAHVVHDGANGVALDRSTITGILDLRGATFTNPGGDALSIENLRIVGNVLMSDAFRTEGRVRAGGIKIEGSLSVEQASLNNAGGDALSLPGAEISNGFFARQLTVHGRVFAPVLLVGGQLDMEGASLINHDDATLLLDGSTITGDFLLRQCSVIGGISASGLKVSGRFILAGTELLSEKTGALWLAGASIREMILGNLRVEGRFDLTRASITELDVVGDPPAPLAAAGWDIGNLHGPMHNNWAAVDRWLATAPAEVSSVQPWQEMADVFKNNGNPSGARHLRYSAAKRLARQSSTFEKAVGYANQAVIGYGYYPFRVVLSFAAVLFVTWALVHLGRSNIVPAKPEEALKAVQAHAAQTHTQAPQSPITGATPCEILHPSYPCLQPITFTFTNLLPTSGSTSITPDWGSRSDSWLTVALILSKIIAWALVALFLAGISGLLRKE